jgi:hypothetical protein
MISSPDFIESRANQMDEEEEDGHGHHVVGSVS